MKVIGKSVWTTETYALHNEAMRVAEEKFQTERDKRYTEGNELRAMALKIKETADANALELASESQTYKEARNDAMREQNLKETGIYATRDDLAAVFTKTEKALATVVDEMKLAFKPLMDHVAADKGANMSQNKFYAGIVILFIILEFGFKFLKF